jgi:DNA-binding MarR family transcriptional regulator
MKPANEIVMLLLQAANAGYVGRDSGALSNAELMALRFFNHANESSRTSWALMEFQGASRADAAKTVKSLVARGHLITSRNEADDDHDRLTLTDLGRAALAPDPCEALVGAVGALAGDEQIALRQALRQVLLNLVEDTAHSYFNSCLSCGMKLDGDPHGAPADVFMCSLYDRPIRPGELDKICLNFLPSEQAAAANGANRRAVRSPLNEE